MARPLAPPVGWPSLSTRRLIIMNSADPKAANMPKNKIAINHFMHLLCGHWY
jgi:hypothetical protein